MPGKRKDLNIKGANLWYLVGLITSDGCLSGDGRHIDITSKDYSLLEQIKNSSGIVNKICIKENGKKQKSFRIQIGNKNFYDFLLSVGLTSKKSLTIGALNVEDSYFVDFLRGEIDGDGCMRTWIHPSNKGEQWSLRIYSGSEVFIKWLNGKISFLFKIQGRIHKERKTKRVLKFGKMAAKEIAARCYYKDRLGLDRKIKLANECLVSSKGWNRSKTASASLRD